MAIREVRACGLDYLALATELLHRARLAEPEAGLCDLEAADLQWWWRTPRRSDTVEQLFWVDDDGPVAGVVLTDWVEHGDAIPSSCPMLRRFRFPPSGRAHWKPSRPRGSRRSKCRPATTTSNSSVCWPRPASRLTIAESGKRGWMPKTGPTWPHWRKDSPSSTAPSTHLRRTRCGDVTATESKLGSGKCSLYDPALDLAVEAPDGKVAGYALFWFDPVTGVGMVEPMRVEDAYQRRGLARALLTTGLDRLAKRGARRLKVAYATEAARRLYVGAGFRVTSTSTSHSRRKER